jgi:hypothetical protein
MEYEVADTDAQIAALQACLDALITTDPDTGDVDETNNTAAN